MYIKYNIYIQNIYIRQIKRVWIIGCQVNFLVMFNFRITVVGVGMENGGQSIPVVMPVLLQFTRIIK